MSDLPCRASIDLATHELNEEKLEARYRDWVSSGERGAAIEKELEELMTDPELVIEGIGPDGSKEDNRDASDKVYAAWGKLAFDQDFALLGIAVSKQLFSYVIDRAIENAENNWRADDE